MPKITEDSIAIYAALLGHSVVIYGHPASRYDGLMGIVVKSHPLHGLKVQLNVGGYWHGVASEVEVND